MKVWAFYPNNNMTHFRCRTARSTRAVSHASITCAHSTIHVATRSPLVSRFPSMYFYHGQITDAVLPDDRPLPLGFTFPKGFPVRLSSTSLKKLLTLQVAFIPTKGSEKQNLGHRSIHNSEEAKVVVETVRNLLSVRSLRYKSRCLCDIQVSRDQTDALNLPQLQRKDIGVISPYAGSYSPPHILRLSSLTI